MARIIDHIIKQPIIIGLIVLLLIVSVSGCVDFVRSLEETAIPDLSDPVLKKADPYLDEMVFDNVTLRAYAATAVSGGPSGDKEYQVNKLYRYVVENYAYYSDPRSREFIQDPFETIQIGGGDCEDLTILLCSLLENIGIRSYFVMTENHTYCLVAGLDEEKLRGYVDGSIIEVAAGELAKKEKMDTLIEDGKLYLVNEKSESMVLKDNYLWYYGGDGSKFNLPIQYMNMEYSVTSTQPISIYVVPSKADYEALRTSKNFNEYPSNRAENILKISDICETMLSHGGLVLKNDAGKDSIVDVLIKTYYSYSTQDFLKDKDMTSCVVNNQTCIVLDPTAGIYGYVGASGKPADGEVVAIDPIKKDYYYIQTGNV
ncbi:hypothetical protein CUJ83_02455 [Methanocella sp. CWC-04]|uniref:Transglutaminase-like domain-containing protein n=1 Tax=Methanooceanicella nereidis TaxID=2052831 RepID=A0AAP2RB13_9EURY|nr:transglutaminase-like domain-containing protein [Methanocella sp. CWC-04]MCD1293859.1 hypothetical protein [Methanocella sp. CWC-04]